MKDSVKCFGIIVLATAIGISVTVCASTGSANAVPASEPGKLTITGLDEYNGLRIAAELHEGNIEAGSHLFMGDNPMTGTPMELTAGAVIKNGTVILNVWNRKVESSRFDEKKKWYTHTYNNTLYTGNDELLFFVFIWDGDRDVYHWHNAVAVGDVPVKFSNGMGSGVFAKNASEE